MLKLDGRDFGRGRSRFHDSSGRGAQEAKIYVKVEVAGFQSPLLALLDTGAPWCVFEAEVCEAIGLNLEQGPETTLSTRRGRFDGKLVRVPVTLLADEGEGESLEVESTVFVAPDWPGDNFIGYSGLLTRVRFALDPAPQQKYFYFGPVE